jgi:hypothetical protein
VSAALIPKDPSFPDTFDSTLVALFLQNSKFKYLKPEVVQLYKKHNYEFLWYDSNGMNEFLLYYTVIRSII